MRKKSYIWNNEGTKVVACVSTVDLCGILHSNYKTGKMDANYETLVSMYVKSPDRPRRIEDEVVERYTSWWSAFWGHYRWCQNMRDGYSI